MSADMKIGDLMLLAKAVSLAYETQPTLIDAMHAVTDQFPNAPSDVIRGMWLAINEVM